MQHGLNHMSGCHLADTGSSLGFVSGPMNYTMGIGIGNAHTVAIRFYFIFFSNLGIVSQWEDVHLVHPACIHSPALLLTGHTSACSSFLTCKVGMTIITFSSL